MKIDYTNDMVFSFTGPNLCLLGNETDFKNLAHFILDLTEPNAHKSISLLTFPAIEITGLYKDVIFSCVPGASSLGILKNEQLVFELDNRYWERLFKVFVLMSWNKSTYYLNADDSILEDLKLEQECNLICSSEF